jgi:hypothetical protein
MKYKIIYYILGIIFFNYSFDVSSILPKKEQFSEITKTKICNGRDQLKKYKEIYEAHLQKFKEDKNSHFTKDVENLDIPLSWAYANAYARLQELEKNDASITKIIGCSPTEALERLFYEHVEDPSIPLSITTFKNYVLDIVDLMDLYFHNNDPELWKETIDEVFSNKNNSNAYDLFSPVFLRKQGLGFESINFAFFDNSGPYLSVTEVGPNRNAHDQRYSNTNRKFILRHDLIHDGDTIRYLTRSKIFSLFQQFYECIINAEISKGNLDVLQLGFYLLTHEHLSVWERYTHTNESNLINMLNYGIDATIDLLCSNFLYTDADTYVVLYKDSLEGIVNLVKKHNAEKDSVFSATCNNLKPSNRSMQNFRDLNLFLNAFKTKFKKAMKQVCCNIEQL